MTSKELREKRAPLAVEIKRLADLVNNENRDFTAEEKEKWEDVNERYNDLTRRIELAERAEKVEADQAEPPAGNRSALPGQEDFNGEQENRNAADGAGGRSGQPAPEDRDLAITAWFRAQSGVDLDESHEQAAQICGVRPHARDLSLDLLSTREVRALSAELGSTGANLIPQGFVATLERALLTFGGMRQVAEVMRTTEGNDIHWPTSDDTSNSGVQIGENTAVSEQNIAVGQVIFKAYKFSSNLIKVPFELIEDSAIDLPSLLGSMLGERLGRIGNTKQTTGTGAGPEGITVGAATGVTTASATAIAADEVIELIHSVDPAYRMGAGFMMHDNILLELRKLKDGEGNYLWQPGFQADVADRLLGYPITINQDMASAVTTTLKTIVYGQLTKYKIRDVGSIRLRRLVERYADSDQEGFVAFTRMDGRLVDAGTNPVKMLVQT